MNVTTYPTSMRPVWLIFVAIAIPGVLLAADPIAWRVVKVHDGDTVHCLRGDNVTLKVRLQAIDAPELGQPFGKASRERLAEHGRPSTASCFCVCPALSVCFSGCRGGLMSQYYR